MKLTNLEAISRLPEKEYIHTFVNPSGMLIGADWTKRQVLEAFNEFGVEESGETATRMGHGLCVKRDGENRSGFVFIETKKEK